MKEAIAAISSAAVIKSETLGRSWISYLMLTMLGGMFVGFGVILLVTIGGQLDGHASTKIIQGLAFGVALSMVILGGADLFTGNNLVMTIGTLEKKTTWKDTGAIWAYSYIGNFAGALLCALMYRMTGLASGGIGIYIEQLAIMKMNAPFMELLFRGVLCNVLVCLAVWCSYKLKSESAKLLMIFCCIFPFITIGFEHSIANMTLLSLALLLPHGDMVSVVGMFANLIPVSIGNLIGGALFIGGMFWHSQNGSGKLEKERKASPQILEQK